MNRLMVLGVLFASAAAYGVGTLQLGEPKVEGNRITIPVLLGGDLGTGVSAMDFRFRYNPQVVQPVSVMPGTTAVEAQKRVMSNLRTPGEYSIVMMGFNQSSLKTGEAIEIVLQRLENTEQDPGVGLAEATMSSVDGSPIESEVLPPRKGSVKDPDQSDDGTGTSKDPKPSGEQNVAPDSSNPVEQAPEVVVDAVASKPNVDGVSTADTAHGLKTALEEAAATRAAIGNPNPDSGEVGSGGVAEQPAGEQKVTEVASAAVTDSERVNKPDSEASDETANGQKKSVEHQSVVGHEPAKQADTDKVVYGAVCLVGLLVVGLWFAHKRLFG